MQRKYLRAVVAALAMLGVIGLAACGGDDDTATGDDTSDTPAAQAGNATDNGDSESGDANGDDASGGSDNGGGSAGSPANEDYIRTMCNIVGDFQEETVAASQDLDAEASEAEIAEAVAPSFRNLAEAAGEANPPEDLSSAHEEMVTALENAADTLEAGDEGAMQEVRDVQLDPQIQQRMLETGRNLEACQQLFAAPGGG